jgi:Lon protease-like protein
MRVEKPAGGGDEFDRYVEAAVEAERRIWKDRVDAARSETRAVREQNDRMLKTLSAIFALLPLDPVEVNGQTFVFQNPMANETLRRLKLEIDAIPEMVNAIRNAQISPAFPQPSAK